MIEILKATHQYEKMHCPRCKTSEVFSSENYESLTIDRCSKCKGVWLDEGELPHILDTKYEKFNPELVKETIQATFQGVPEQEKMSVEKCPKCQAQMNAVNYAYSSGIIIDRCPNGHGAWLDHMELEKVQAHREHWAGEAKLHLEEWEKFARSSNEMDKDHAKNHRRSEMRPSKFLVDSLIRKILRF